MESLKKFDWMEKMIIFFKRSKKKYEFCVIQTWNQILRVKTFILNNNKKL
jgi:hypothetical protein